MGNVAVALIGVLLVDQDTLKSLQKWEFTWNDCARVYIYQLIYLGQSMMFYEIKKILIFQRSLDDSLNLLKLENMYK